MEPYISTADLITETATKPLTGREHALHGHTAESNDSCPGQTETDGIRL